MRWYKLRLRCRDDAKGPVTAVCGFHGYLVSSMGQKVCGGVWHPATRPLALHDCVIDQELTCVPQVFVRAFDSDERLVGVAFIDVGIYVTSLRTLKNLLLVGDAVKSVMFVAFQVCTFLSSLLCAGVRSTPLRPPLPVRATPYQDRVWRRRAFAFAIY